MKNHTLISGCVLLCLIWGPIRAPGQSIPAISLDPNALPPAAVGGPGDFGWTFRISEPVTVTGLAFFDDSQNGLLQQHTVSLWRLTNAEPGLWWWFSNARVELTSVVVPAGNTARLDGVWRQIDLPSALTLQVGNYGLFSQASPTNLDLDIAGPPSIFNHGLDSRFEIGGTFTVYFDGTIISSLDLGAVLGPVVFVEAIPEPSVLCLLAMATGLMCISVFRGNRRLIDDRWTGNTAPFA